MSTITRGFTKEQLIEKLQHRIAVAAKYPDLEEAQLDAAIFKIALASLEAEAVGEVVLGEYDDCGCHPDARVACIAADGQADWENFKDGTRLYTAPPVPVSVPDDVIAEDCPAFIKYDLTEVDEAWARGFNACRAAMLQGAEPDFREISNSSTKHFRENAETSTKCWCHTCRPVKISDMRFVVCPECGNKRCPHANDHRHACTGSNEPGQEGSAYPASPQEVKGE